MRIEIYTASDDGYTRVWEGESGTFDGLFALGPQPREEGVPGAFLNRVWQVCRPNRAGFDWTGKANRDPEIAVSPLKHGDVVLVDLVPYVFTRTPGVADYLSDPGGRRGVYAARAKLGVSDYRIVSGFGKPLEGPLADTRSTPFDSLHLLIDTGEESFWKRPKDVEGIERCSGS